MIVSIQKVFIAINIRLYFHECSLVFTIRSNKWREKSSKVFIISQTPYKTIAIIILLFLWNFCHFYSDFLLVTLPF